LDAINEQGFKRLSGISILYHQKVYPDVLSGCLFQSMDSCHPHCPGKKQNQVSRLYQINDAMKLEAKEPNQCCNDLFLQYLQKTLCYGFVGYDTLGIGVEIR